mmetsp:Transcript_3547/g.11042  ORF Transcript_3547/g.11042 Transcript_3547/m.11042 type:complete len:338 (-) Transcript_3547:399-1412(-)
MEEPQAHVESRSQGFPVGPERRDASANDRVDVAVGIGCEGHGGTQRWTATRRGCIKRRDLARGSQRRGKQLRSLSLTVARVVVGRRMINGALTGGAELVHDRDRPDRVVSRSIGQGRLRCGVDLRTAVPKLVAQGTEERDELLEASFGDEKCLAQDVVEHRARRDGNLGHRVADQPRKHGNRRFKSWNGPCRVQLVEDAANGVQRGEAKLKRGRARTGNGVVAKRLHLASVRRPLVVTEGREVGERNGLRARHLRQSDVLTDVPVIRSAGGSVRSRAAGRGRGRAHRALGRRFRPGLHRLCVFRLGSLLFCGRSGRLFPVRFELRHACHEGGRGGAP